MARALLLSLLLALPLPAEWIRLRTPELELLTDAGDKAGARMLDRLAEVRAIVGQGRSAGPQPLRVFLFDSEREFRTYTDGAATHGFYQSGPERDYIVMHDGSGLTRIAAHEYVHLILNHSAAKFPRWLDEGMAEFYSTLELSGKRLLVGAPIEAHLYTLHNRPLLSARELEDTGKSAGYFTEREMAGIYYAQSWALTHLLNLSPDWRQGMPGFVEQLTAGTDSDTAFQSAFGRTLDQAIQALAGYRPRTASLDAAEQAKEQPLQRSKVSTLESLLLRGDLALHASKPETAFNLFQEAARQNPAAAEAEAGLGTLAMALNRRGEAQKHLEKALQMHAPGGELYFELAMLKRESGAPQAEIDALLQQALIANPNYAEAHVLLGVRATDQKDYARAIHHLQTAAGILPRQSYIWHSLAFAQEKAGLRDAARESARRALQTAQSLDHERMAQALLRSLE